MAKKNTTQKTLTYTPEEKKTPIDVRTDAGTFGKIHPRRSSFTGALLEWINSEVRITKTNSFEPKHNNKYKILKRID